MPFNATKVFGTPSFPGQVDMASLGWTQFSFSLNDTVTSDFPFYDDDGSHPESRIIGSDIPETGIFITSFSFSINFTTTGDIFGYELEWFWGTSSDNINVPKSLSGVSSFSETHTANILIPRKGAPGDLAKELLTLVELNRGTDGSPADSQSLGVSGYYK